MRRLLEQLRQLLGSDWPFVVFTVRHLVSLILLIGSIRIADLLIGDSENPYFLFLRHFSSVVLVFLFFIKVGRELLREIGRGNKGMRGKGRGSDRRKPK